MKKGFAFLYLAGLLLASCHSTPTVNSANSNNDSIKAVRLKDSMLNESKKTQIQDSIDALKKDTAKKS